MKKHRIGFKQTAVLLNDGSFAEQNFSVGANGALNSKVTLSTTVAQVLPASGDRVAAIITNTGNATAYLGDASVVSTTGYPLPQNSTIRIELAGELYGIMATGSGELRVLTLTN